MNNLIKNQKIKISLMLLLCLGITLLLEKYYYTLPLSIERDTIVFLGFSFIGLNFVCDRKKMYSFLYEKRYYIGAILLFLLVIFGFHGSSINFWDYYVQPSYTKTEYQPVLGEARAIRSDEWVVNSPIDLSQSKLKDPFSSVNNIMRGTDTSVALIAKSPIKSINILVNPFKVVYMLLGNESGMSFWWFGRLFALLFLSFEMLMILTNKNKKLSFVGAIMTTFASVVQWWFSTSIVDILIYGQAAVIVFAAFFKTDKRKNKILLSIAMGIIGASYICIYYPAWQIAFGYVYLILFIWLLYKNKDKINLKLLGYLAIVLVIVITIVGYMLYDSKEALEVILNTAYPGRRVSVGGAGWQLLFTYFTSFLYSFKNLTNPCENSQFFCLFPVPIVIGIWQLFKQAKNSKKIDPLLAMFVILPILLVVWNFIELPAWLAKITLLSMSTPQRAQVAIGYTMILLLIYLLAEYKDQIRFNKISSFIISLIVALLGLSVTEKMFPNYMPTIYAWGMGIIIFSIIFMILHNCKKCYNVIIISLTVMTIVPGITVNPLNRGLSVMYEKPLAKKIQEIVKEDSESKWLVATSYYLIPNYFIVNGAPTINSVNVYPNLELWRKFDKDRKYDDIYNRYAHIVVEFTQDDSYYEFTQGYYDLITLKMNYKDLEKANVKYVATDKELDEELSEMYKMEKIYDELGILIYELKS